MRALIPLFLLASMAAAQNAPSGAMARGVLLERDAPADSGQFALRAPDNHVFRYRFDPKTYVEREQKPTTIASLNAGDRIEVVSDADPNGSLRYALMVRVLADAVPQAPVLAGRVSSVGVAPLRAGSLGSMTFSGVALQVEASRFVLRSRDGKDRTILLRQDTSFLDGGEGVTADALKPNMRVTVLAGPAGHGEFEARQVFWGGILHP